jgi:hypothetical protein
LLSLLSSPWWFDSSAGKIVSGHGEAVDSGMERYWGMWSPSSKNLRKMKKTSARQNGGACKSRGAESQRAR